MSITMVQSIQKERVRPSFVNPVERDDDLTDGGRVDTKAEIRKPGVHDVLLGRGGGTNNHAGNVQFRQLVNKHKMRYLSCSKVDKPKVAREVVNLWRKMDPIGRFLHRKDETRKGPGSVKDSSNIWIEVGDKKAREKASQCLRERTPDVIPYLSQLRQHQDHMTEQGVSMVQQQMQMSQNNPNYSPPVVGNVPASRRNSLVDMPERPTHLNTVNRRGSMPVASNPMPVTPTNMAIHTRRGSMPAATHMHNQHQIEMQQRLMARQQQVLREAYTAIERSDNTHPDMGHMQMMSPQQQALAERQALIQQQYARLEGQQMMHSNAMAQNQMMRNHSMMAQNQMMRNQHMTAQQQQQQQQHIMILPSHHRAGVMEAYGQMNRPPQMAMQGGHPNMGHPHHMSKQRSPVGRSNTTGQLPKNIHVPLTGGDDLEPLPYAEDDEPIQLCMVPDAPKSAPPQFISPNLDQHGKKASEKRRKEQGQENGRFDDLAPLPLDPQEAHQQDRDKAQGPKRSSLKNSHAGNENAQPQGDAESTLREYRKTLEEYIINHQIATPAVDIDDDISDEGIGVDGIDASAWIQQALNDSADLSLTNKKKGDRRSLNRENSKKSLMSTGTSYMSLALSDMEQSEEHSTRQQRRMSGARSMASNQSLMSELTDFDDLDCL